jgi:hypothetical protein
MWPWTFFFVNVAYWNTYKTIDCPQHNMQCRVFLLSFDWNQFLVTRLKSMDGELLMSRILCMASILFGHDPAFSWLPVRPGAPAGTCPAVWGEAATCLRSKASVPLKTYHFTGYTEHVHRSLINRLCSVKTHSDSRVATLRSKSWLFLLLYCFLAPLMCLCQNMMSSFYFFI